MSQLETGEKWKTLVVSLKRAELGRLANRARLQSGEALKGRLGQRGKDREMEKYERERERRIQWDPE